MTNRDRQRRQAAKAVRAQLARERRRRVALWTTVAGIAVLIIAALTGWGLYGTQRNKGAAPVSPPPGSVADGTGIGVGSGPVQVHIYEDFQCPVCKQFEVVSGPTLDQLVAQNRIQIVQHPVAFLNRFSSTEYSTRSSAASGCAAEEGKFREYARALYLHQPPENSAGLPDDQLISIGTDLGLDPGKFGTCVRNGKYRSWTERVTDAAAANNVTGTPTVRVNGKQVTDLSPQGIIAAVDAASGTAGAPTAGSPTADAPPADSPPADSPPADSPPAGSPTAGR